jgi:prophage antirepressor-like protein
MNKIKGEWKMKNELVVFNNKEFGEVRSMMIDGNPWFVAKDIAKALGYVDEINAIKNHCCGVAIYHPIVDSIGRTQEVRIINEPDVYRLIIGSKLPAAVKFQDWVFEEVLPSIRKHGMYATEATIDNILENPDFGIELLTKVKEERAAKKLAEAQRDEAIRTKAQISDTKTATALGKVGGLTKQNNILKKKVGLIEGYATIAMMEKRHGGKYNWRLLVACCTKHNLKIEKVPCPRYDEVNTYPLAAWKIVYGIE